MNVESEKLHDLHWEPGDPGKPMMYFQSKSEGLKARRANSGSSRDSGRSDVLVQVQRQENTDVLGQAFRQEDFPLSCGMVILFVLF